MFIRLWQLVLIVASVKRSDASRIGEAEPDYSLLKRALTPDNTCGNVNNGLDHNYTCDPNLSGGGACCSQYGYCGESSISDLMF